MTTLHPAVERANALLAIDRRDEAEALVRRRLAEDPEDIRAWVKLAQCHLVEPKDVEGAFDATERALALGPEDTGALIMRAHALWAAGGRLSEAEEVLREVVRLDPHHWYGYAKLADTVFTGEVLRVGRAKGGTLRAHDVDAAGRAAEELAMTALRLGPEEVYAHEVAWKIAYLSGNRTVADQMDEAILRLDPQHQYALARRAEKAATAPGVKATQAATVYADALSAAPESASLRNKLDDASYRLLRGVRWLALLCLALAGTMLDLFAVEGETQRELPVSLGQRLWTLVPMAVIWALGALLRYRRLRAGIRINLRSLIHRRRWPRIVLAQATWAMFCALLIAQVPWSDRTVPQIIFWAGLLPTAATILFDRKKRG
ncbi:tetratricopeptide repeat protein [Streptomyces sp. NPDC002787]